MELKLLLTLLRRWAWLLILGLILGAGGAYVATLYEAPVYQASTKIMIVEPLESRVSKITDLSAWELVQTYMSLLNTRPVLDATAERLGFAVGGGQVDARNISGTQLVEVTVQDNDPQRAALIANTLVEVLIAQNEALQVSRFSSSEESLKAQVEQVEDQIDNLQADLGQQSEEALTAQQQEVESEKQELESTIAELQNQVIGLELELDELTPRAAPGQEAPSLTPEQRAQLQQARTELTQLRFDLRVAEQDYLNLLSGDGGGEEAVDARRSQQEANLALYQQIYSTLLSNYESVRLARLQNTPNVVQVEAATPPAAPIRPRPLQNTLLGGAVGLLIMGGIAFLIEYLDDTLKTPDDVAHVMRTPVIGYLTVIPDLKEVKDQAYVGAHPRSPVAEAFRGLRTNLEFAGVDKPLKTILVTSTSPKDGKTTIAANLAVAMAQGNKRVVLLDGDLRRPAIHRMFGIANRTGLSDIFRGQLKLADALHQGARGRLGVITSGSLPPNPTELLDSEKMTQILAALRESADVVIIDSPPLMVADAPVLAAKVDGVLLVVQPGKTHADAAQAVVEQLDRADARVVGVVFNRIPRKRADYYGGYRYYYSPYYQDHKEYYYMDGHSQNGRPSANGGQRKQQGFLNRLRNSGKK